MADKDKIESLLKLADFSWRDYSERRSIEWKINFALWLGLGTFAGFMFQRPTPLRGRLAVMITLVLAFTFLVYIILWKAEIKERNRVDKAATQHYLTEVRKELSVESPPLVTPKRWTDWPSTHLSQVVITFLFVLLAILAIWAPR